jgi:hypothetical protein
LEERDTADRVPDGIQFILRLVEQKDCVIALRGATKEVRARALSSMSERVRTFIEEETEGLRAVESGDRLLGPSRDPAITGTGSGVTTDILQPGSFTGRVARASKLLAGKEERGLDRMASTSWGLPCCWTTRAYSSEAA